jgi:hypothetical protein
MQISFSESDLVFLGELIDFDTIDYSYTYRIIEEFKGEFRSSIIKGKYFDSCSKFPREKGKWIVYADFKNGFIDISQCLASRSEINPICINCYEIPQPVSSEDNIKISLLKAKALNDWKNEIEILRKLK